jgi:hypothetical protein
VLARILAAYSVIHLLAPKGRVNHYRLATDGSLNLLKQFSQALEIYFLGSVRRVVKLAVVGYRQFL